MERSRGIVIYGMAIVVFGFYNLLGAGDYGHFKTMFQPLPAFVITGIYFFTVFYGICGVYCGRKILKLEDWSRKLMVVLTVISVVSGLALNRIVMANFREFLQSGNINIPPDMIGPVSSYMVVLTVLITLFEMSVIYYFTRPGVAHQFRACKA